MRPEPTYNREIGLEGSTHAVISRDVSCMIHFVVASRNLLFELCVGIDEKKISVSYIPYAITRILYRMNIFANQAI